MKKILSIVLGIVILAVSGISFAEELPTINNVLKDPEFSGQVVEVSDDLEPYQPENPDLEDYGDLNVIILQREMPEKEFTEKMVPAAQIESEDGFPDDFTGVDLGDPRVWYRGDLMQQIPEIFRASSLEDADLLVIAENSYVWSGTISVTDFEEDGETTLPDFETTEELEEYLQSHQKVIASITYYPKFGVYSLIDIYGAATKECAINDYQYTEAKRFARNPEASDLWDDMLDLLGVLQEMNEETPDMAGVSASLSGFDFLPEETIKSWTESMDAGEIPSLSGSMEDYFWQMAENLKGLEPSENNREKYEMIIRDRDYNALVLFADFCDYSGFDQSVESIRDSKEYYAKYDPDWMEEQLAAFVDVMNGL